MSVLTIGSLFAGIGGLELGLEMTGGFRTIWSVEIEEYCNEVRKRHWPDVPQYKDVRAFPPPSGVEIPDVLCGGSPCQDLSCAGKRSGLAGERSGLFLQMVRIIRELRPRSVVWENVAGALSSNGGRDFGVILGSLANLGYDAEWTVLRASDFGHAHKRRRIFLVAYRASRGCKEKRRGPPEEDRPTGAPGDNRLLSRRSFRPCGLVADSHSLKRGPQHRDCAAASVRTESEEGRECLANGNGSKRGECRQPQSKNENTISKYKRMENPAIFDQQSGRNVEGLERVPLPSAPSERAPGPGERERWREILEERPWLAPAIEPGLCRVVNGFPVVVDASRAQRLRALGNAIVPDCARWVGERILRWEENHE